MARFRKFTPSINNIIPPHTIDQSNAAIESRINDAIDALFEDLYPSIAAAAQDFNVPTRTLQRRIDEMSLLSGRSPNNQALSDAQGFGRPRAGNLRVY